MAEPPTRQPRELNGRPWLAKVAGGVLTEHGLGTLLSIVLVLALLWGGYTILTDARAFQSQMIAESVRTNEKLESLQLSHIEHKLALDRIERLLLAELGKTP